MKKLLRSLSSALATSAVAALFVAVAASAQAADTDKNTSAALKLKLLSANIRLAYQESEELTREILVADEHNGVGWNTRKDMCGRIIAKQEADIICLQESRDVQVKDILGHLKNFASYGLSHRAPEYYPTNAILYSQDKFDLITCGGFYLSETPHIEGSIGWDSLRPRFANWIELKEKQTGKVLRVWNTHIDHRGKIAKINQVQMILDAAKVFPADLPQFFVGDFNQNEKTTGILNIKKAGWTDTYEQIHKDDPWPHTVHQFYGPGYTDFLKTQNKTPNSRIDWIFTKGPIKTLDAQIVRDHENGKYPSDHYFINATVEIH